ncbi:MAG: hypothetical protein L0177_01615 [Chloroflexi bacterium]|nr:hypothetical protein [Chloroflexota bacterium]
MNCIPHRKPGYFKLGILAVLLLLTFAVSTRAASGTSRTFPTGAESLQNSSSSRAAQSSQLGIPQQSDWTAHGTVLTPGPSGSWDAQLGGTITPCGVVKKDGTYFLYYIGGSFTGSNGDSRNRSLGVATSSDGISFTKYSGNPIMTPSKFGEGYGPTGEGGIAACAPYLDSNGDIILHYGAMVEYEYDQVYIDSRLAVSSDGFSFTDVGLVIDHSDSSRWGYGDELVPDAALVRSDGTVLLYYICMNGARCKRTLGLATGSSHDSLPSTQGVITSGEWVLDSSAVMLDSETAALFVTRDWDNWIVEVRTVSLSNPAAVSAPLASYDFNAVLPSTHNSALFPGVEFSHNTVFLDREAGKWLMYYHLGDPQTPVIAAMSAPFVGDVELPPPPSVDVTPPTAPGGLTASAISQTRIDLAWIPAADEESGVSHYRVFRDGSFIGQSSAAAYSDTGLAEVTAYSYEVSAVNREGIESARSGAMAATTTADTTPPAILSVALRNSSELAVVFTEPVSQSSAANSANYHISGGISVIGASLDAGQTTVTLATTAHLEEGAYTLTVNNVTDTAKAPNTILQDSQRSYSYIASLVISNLSVASGNSYEWATLDVGVQPYVDRDYTFTQVPGELAGLDLLKTANSDKTASQQPFISFDANQAATVYIAYDDRLGRPAWMSEFEDTGHDLQISAGTNYSVWARDFPAGNVTLGPNMGVSNSSMYVVLLAPSGVAGNAGDLPTLPGMSAPVRDLDGDGKAEDANGNGRLDFADITALFENFASTEVQSNSALFDFNGNGVLDLADMGVLFDIMLLTAG